MLRALAAVSSCAVAAGALGLVAAGAVADLIAPGSRHTLPYIFLGALAGTAAGAGLAGFAAGRLGARLKAGRVAAAALLLGAWPAWWIFGA